MRRQNKNKPFHAGVVMLSFQKVFPRAAANVIGMVHALPMPATPLYEGGRGVEAIVERATAEARLYSGTIPTT